MKEMCMRILKILAWIVVPYIMIFVDWKTMSRTHRIIGVIYTGVVLLSAFSNSSHPNASDAVANDASAVQTQPTAIDTGGDAAADTAVPVAANETAIPATATSIPATETAVPPTETAVPIEPIVITGNGDSIEDFTRSYGAGLYTIEGNACDRFFAVTSFDSAGKQIDLLVNETKPYAGIRPMDFGDTTTTRLEIKASCAWKITINPLSTIRTFTVPGDVRGAGDDVVLLQGGTPDLADITGNASSRYFGVFSYGKNGYDVLVNTTEPYQGSVMLDSETLILEVKSNDDWTISVKTR
jgi:hypothetical protein